MRPARDPQSGNGARTKAASRRTEFAGALEELIGLARSRRTAIMCAEALWWRCHRALISDALRMRGFDVQHIVDESPAVAHPFTSAARVVDGRLSYAAAPASAQNATSTDSPRARTKKAAPSDSPQARARRHL